MRVSSALFAFASFGLVLGALACSAGDDAGTADDDIVGGQPSSLRSIVVVADANDHYLCAGALVRADVVAMPEPCARLADAVYFGYAADVVDGEPLSLKARATTEHVRVRRAAWLPTVQACATGLRETVGLVTLSRPALGVTPLALATSVPAAGGTCTLVGTGPQAYGDPFGSQRSATTRVTGVAAAPECRVDAKGVDGSIALGDYDAFLLCSGGLAGLKRSTVTYTAQGIDNEVAFTTFTSAEARRAFELTLASMSADAGPGPGPAPVPGAACAVQNEVGSADCGQCGTRQAVCLDEGAGKQWSAYGACQREGQCTPGAVETTTAGCLAGTVRRRGCSTACGWGPFGACL